MGKTRATAGVGKGLCSEDDCAKTVYAKGMCANHYKRHRYWVTTTDPRNQTSEPDLPGERWRAIPGYESSHQASNLGRIRSIDRIVPYVDGRDRRRKGRILSGSSHPTGHLYVNLGHSDLQAVHRLVLLTFVGPCPEGLEGCHKNGDPTDNCVKNLRWDTRSGNMFDRVRHGNDPHRNRTHCPSGHILAMPNLKRSSWKRGFRVCLTCHRTQANAQTAKRLGWLFDFDSRAAHHYARIMGTHTST